MKKGDNILGTLQKFVSVVSVSCLHRGQP